MVETLDAQLSGLIGEAGDVGIADGSEYARDGRLFAVRPESNVVELRLGSEIADAARRTPDTSASSRGDDWITFSPKQWDEHAADRLAAWFRVAWRLADRGR